MNGPELLDRFEQGSDDERKALISEISDPQKFSELFFLRIADYVGRDPNAALRLSEDWKLVATISDGSFAWRAKAARERLQGRWSKSAKSFLRAGELAPNELDRLSFQVGAIDSLARAGSYDEAIRLGDKLSRGLARLGRQDLAARAMLNVGNVYLWQDRHREAKEAFLAAKKNLQIGYELAAALLGISTASLFIDAPKVALENALAAERMFEELGAAHYGLQARVNEGHCRVRLGQSDQAIRIFLSMRVEFDPASLDYARICQFLGDAFLDLDLHEEAVSAYEAGLKSPGITHSILNRANCLLGLGEAFARQGQPKASAHLLRAKRFYLRAGNETFAHLAQYLQCRQRLTLGKVRSADLANLRHCVSFFRRSKLNFYFCSAGLDLAEFGAPDESRSLLKVVANKLRRHDYISLRWRVHALRAQRLLMPAQKRSEYRKMASAIVQHRAGLTTLTARTSLSRGKEQALREYLALILESPRSSSVNEAMRVIRNFRSTALLDEILRSAPPTLSQPALAALDALRSEIITESDDDLPEGPLRRLPQSVQSNAALLQRYREATHWDEVPRLDVGAAGKVNTFTFLPSGSAWLVDGKRVRLDLDELNLGDALRWIQFELAAPLQGLTSDLPFLNSACTNLGSALQIDKLYRDGELLPVCPESTGYAIPWSLIAHQEPLILLRPDTYHDPRQIHLNADAKVAIWYHARSDLPHVKEEVEILRSEFPKSTICTTVQEVLSTSQNAEFDLVHVAAHGSYVADNPMFSGIQFEDGNLLACDLARSGMTARLAVISSCDSASIGHRGWEPQGWARAFLACRAKVVIGSQWRLDDKVAAITFAEFYRKMSMSCSVFDSLRAAKSVAREFNAHPSYWAPLVMIGGFNHDA